MQWQQDASLAVQRAHVSEGAPVHSASAIENGGGNDLGAWKRGGGMEGDGREEGEGGWRRGDMRMDEDVECIAPEGLRE